MGQLSTLVMRSLCVSRQSAFQLREASILSELIEEDESVIHGLERSRLRTTGRLFRISFIVMERLEGPEEDSEGQKESPELLTRKMAAARLCISTRTLDRMANDGFIERVFLGSVVRFRAKDITEVIDNGV